MYSHKKVAKTKELKTLSSSIDVIKAVEQQTMKALESQNLKRTLLSARKVHWFEKFNWFISTEGYLILSGRDAQQNDTLYKKYLRASDIYVHADISGASSCIVRAKLQQTANSISPLAIQEAGIMAVCRSSAWTNKVITSAWWVLASQVSKSAPTGEFLTTGSFMIYGSFYSLLVKFINIISFFREKKFSSSVSIRNGIWYSI
jgi:predicted ribosome quality control (RQC) complex YloA/Tae2 family protein